jgi:membrane-associated phospholipid phosphatase
MSLPPPNLPQDSARTGWRASFIALVRDDQRRRYLLLRLGLLVFMLVVGLASIARVYTVLPLDLWFTRELQENQYLLIARVMYGISIFGYDPYALITVAAGVVLVSAALGWRAGAYLLAVTAAQGLINAALKLLIGRPRPVESAVDVFVPEHGNSFPSGHVMFYTVFFGMLLFFAWTHIKRAALRRVCVIMLLVLIALIGPSRIILGAHWLSDVIAAYLIGLILLAGAIEGFIAFPSIRARPRSAD